MSHRLRVRNAESRLFGLPVSLDRAAVRLTAVNYLSLIIFNILILIFFRNYIKTFILLKIKFLILLLFIIS